MSFTDRIYAKLPVALQNASVSLYGYFWHWLRFGPGYADFVQNYLDRERFTPSQWANWQAAQLSKLLPACANHVPYYRATWSADHNRAALNGDLHGLPLLEKDPIRAHPKAFLRGDLHPFLPQTFLTSGSTGTPLSIHYTLPELRQSLALREARSACWAGVSFSLPRATFSGRMVEPNSNSTGPFHRFNLAERQVYLSPFHLSPETASQYVAAFRQHNVQWATGYAVSFYLLARFMLEKDLPLLNLKALVTTSEKLTPEMRSVMQQAYQCKVYEEYSTVENAIFASECEHGRLHLSPDVAVTEILRPDGSPCEPGEPGEVVVTGLSRQYQPFIRYRLGDLAMWDGEPCPCGRSMPVIKDVLGRIEDVIVGPDGRQMVRFHGIFAGQPHVREGQIIQETLQQITVKVVPTEGYGPLDELDIVQRIQQRLGKEVSVSVEIVQEIPRTKAGKFKAVISKIRP